MTYIFGPYIKIMEKMGYDILVYIVVFMISIFALACFGVLFFPSIYPNLFEAIMNMFTLAATSYDVTIFD
jgi:hypothetical protein